MTASQFMFLGALALCLLVATALVALALFAAYAAWRIYRPARLTAERTPEALGMRYEPLRFPAADGRANLAAWLIHANAETRRNHMVLLCHQWGAHKGVSLAHAKIYCDAGFDVMAFDLRNHGDSDYDPVLR
jgi:alpha-beta hydrolase superfamily lysophospholipase